MSTTGDAADLPLLRARHEVVNTLVRYLRAVDAQDLDGVLAELRHAEVSFGGPVTRGVEELAGTYRTAFAAGGRTRHLLHEAEVTEHDGGVVARAAYQRWSLDADPPALTAIGRYHALFHADGDQWRLVQLTVERDWQRT